MNNKIKTIGLAVASIVITTTLSNSIQAAPWKTVPASVCQASKVGQIVPDQVEILCRMFTAL